MSVDDILFFDILVFCVYDDPGCHRAKGKCTIYTKIVEKCVWLMVWTAPGTSTPVRNIHNCYWMKTKSVPFKNSNKDNNIKH